MPNEITLENQGDAAILTLERPDKHNALTLQMWSGLLKAFRLVASDESAKALIIRGSTPDAFSAGNDIAEFRHLRASAESARGYNRVVSGALAELSSLSIPTIAAIQGVCMGAGCRLALCCDLRFAGLSAKLAIPTARLGLVYGLEDTRRLVEAVGRSRALYLLYSGEAVSARNAYEIGLVDRVVEDSELFTVVSEFVSRVAQNSDHSVRSAKRIVGEAFRGEEGDRHLASLLQDEAYSDPFLLEKVVKFLAKRTGTTTK